MSIADTAEYQLDQLAETMTRAHDAADSSGWRNDDFKEGFEAALKAITVGMGLSMKSKMVFWA